MVRKLYTFSFLVMAGVMLTFSSAFAQMMGGSFSLEASLDQGKVELSWEKPENFAVSYYLVYRGEMNYSDTSLNIAYTKIDSTTEKEYTDTSMTSAKSIFIYQVRAYSDSGQMRASNFARVFVDSENMSRDRVTITSTPSLDGTVDSLYTYQVQAVSSDTNSVLSYRLGEDHPPLMTIDSTGLLSWTPQHIGWYDVDVLVISSNGGWARQEFAIRVAGINGTIAGVVTDTLGNPIGNVLVRLYQRDADWHFDYHAVTDSNGDYIIHHVDAGKYFVRALPMTAQYLPQWYGGANSMENAIPVVVTDTTTQYANFKLQDRFAALPHFSVTGTVKDTTGTALKGALVVFARAGFVFNNAKEDRNEWQMGDNYRDIFQNMYQERHNVREFSLDGNSPYIYKTYTDSNGVYTLDSIPQGFYVAYAKASGYQRIFFNNESNLLSADVIAVNSDTTGIDFALSPLPPVALGQISGTVMDSTNGTGLPARIIAFRDVWDYHDTLAMHVARAYFADADSTGAYTLQDLPPGYYKILAIPLGSYAPSFYSLTGPTVKWKDASAIQVDGNSTNGVDIYVMPMASSTSGYTAINGKVSDGSTSQGVGGALVYAFDGNGNLAGYAITHNDGSYTIPGLAPGTYTVSTDVVGYTSGSTSTSSPTYSSTGTAVTSTTDLAVNPIVTAVQQSVAQPVNFTLDQNYPNPFNPTTQIAFSIPSSMHVTVTIFNILGQRIATLVNNNLSAGSHIVTWNARNSNGVMMPSGVYFYRLSTPNFTAVKKMLLLK